VHPMSQLTRSDHLLRRHDSSEVGDFPPDCAAFVELASSTVERGRGPGVPARQPRRPPCAAATHRMSAGIKNDTSRSALIYLKDLENTSKSVAWGRRPNAFHKPDTVSRDWTANRPAGLHRRQRPLGGGVRGGKDRASSGVDSATASFPTGIWARRGASAPHERTDRSDHLFGRHDGRQVGDPPAEGVELV
jgi:hypothetical protein